MPTKKEQGLCSHPRCTNPLHAQGRCRTHYRALRAASASTCKRKRCTEPQHARDLCRLHYGKVIRKERAASRI